MAACKLVAIKRRIYFLDDKQFIKLEKLQALTLTTYFQIQNILCPVRDENILRSDVFS